MRTQFINETLPLPWLSTEQWVRARALAVDMHYDRFKLHTACGDGECIWDAAWAIATKENPEDRGA